MSETVSIGHYSLAVPQGWEARSISAEQLVLSSGRQQQATVSLIRFSEPISFEQFQLLCDKRIAVESKGLTDGYVDPERAFMASASFGMFFSGGDKATGRMFFGYLCQARQELLTIYLEGIDVDPAHHAKDFQALVQSLKGN